MLVTFHPNLTTKWISSNCNLVQPTKFNQTIVATFINWNTKELLKITINNMTETNILVTQIVYFILIFTSQVAFKFVSVHFTFIFHRRSSNSFKWCVIRYHTLWLESISFQEYPSALEFIPWHDLLFIKHMIFMLIEYVRDHGILNMKCQAISWPASVAFNVSSSEFMGQSHAILLFSCP